MKHFKIVIGEQYTKDMKRNYLYTKHFKICVRDSIRYKLQVDSILMTLKTNCVYETF